MPPDAMRLAEGISLPSDIEVRVHEALAILRAKKAALDAGVSRTEVDAHAWTAEVQPAITTASAA